MKPTLAPAVSHYTVGQFAEAAGITRRTFENWRQRGIAPRTIRRGWSVLIPLEDWLDWFRRLEDDRLRTGKPHLRAPLGGRQ